MQWTCLCLTAILITVSSPHSLTDIFSRQELQCLSNGTVFFPRDQKCYNLLEKGPCSTREWLVLKVQDSTRVQAKCEPCRCCAESSKKVFWTADGQCHRTSDKLCGKGNKLTNDLDGTGVCGCKDGFARVDNSNDECFPLFERSTVCVQGQYLRLSNTNTGECVANPCSEDGLAPWTEGGRFSRDQSLCYQINTQGPCPEVDQMFRVMPGEPNIVGCFSPAFSITQVPTLCSAGSSGQCRPPITFESGSGRPTMSTKLQAFLKKKRIAVEEDEPAIASSTNVGPSNNVRPSNTRPGNTRPSSSVRPSPTSHSVNYGPTSDKWSWD